jgi:hypothetical protein
MIRQITCSLVSNLAGFGWFCEGDQPAGLDGPDQRTPRKIECICIQGLNLKIYVQEILFSSENIVVLPQIFYNNGSRKKLSPPNMLLWNSKDFLFYFIEKGTAKKYE